MPITNKQYAKLQMFDRARATKLKCIEYKGGKCERCGYAECPAALQFHHLDPTKKDFGISQRINRSFENLKEELDKCIMLCGNCHVKLHWEEKLKQIEFEKTQCKNVPKTKTVTKCDNCGVEISKWPSTIREHNFCSTPCRIDYNAAWPEDSVMVSLFTTLTITEVAEKFGKSYSSAKKKKAQLKRKFLL